MPHSELCQRRTYLYHRDIFAHPHHVSLCQNFHFWSDSQATDTHVTERRDEHCGPDHPLPDGSISWQVQRIKLKGQSIQDINTEEGGWSKKQTY